MTPLGSLPSGPKRIGLIINPTSGKNTGARIGAQAATLLAARGHQIVDLSAMDAEHARRRAGAAIADQAIDMLVVTGGDGMVNLGVNVCAATGIPLGVVAAGTGNDIARELGLPVRDAVEAVERLDNGALRTIDLARTIRPDGTPIWFAGVLGAGFDAIVNERANQWRWPKGKSRYNLAILRELPGFRAIPYRIILDGEVLESEAMLVAVGNGPAYGGGMRVVPSAEFDDGLLDVLVLSKISTAEFLRVFPRVFSGGHVGHPAVTIHRARHVRLEATGIVGYADGERFAALPMECEAVPGALTVLT